MQLNDFQVKPQLVKKLTKSLIKSLVILFQILHSIIHSKLNRKIDQSELRVALKLLQLEFIQCNLFLTSTDSWKDFFQ